MDGPILVKLFIFLLNPQVHTFFFKLKNSICLIFPFVLALVEPKPSEKSFFDFNNLNTNIKLSTSSSLKLASTNALITLVILFTKINL